MRQVKQDYFSTPHLSTAISGTSFLKRGFIFEKQGK